MLFEVIEKRTVLARITLELFPTVVSRVITVCQREIDICADEQPVVLVEISQPIDAVRVGDMQVRRFAVRTGWPLNALCALWSLCAFPWLPRIISRVVAVCLREVDIRTHIFASSLVEVGCTIGVIGESNVEVRRFTVGTFRPLYPLVALWPCRPRVAFITFATFGAADNRQDILRVRHARSVMGRHDSHARRTTTVY